MSRSKATQLFLRIITTLSQWLLAGTFLFSGFVKAMDPMGMEHKLAAYLVHWGFDVPAGSFYLDVAVLVLALVEFTLGVYLLLGMRKRIAAIGSFAFMLVMTAVTIYIYAFNPVSDCGCFGTALTLTNGETLVKNIVLLLCSLVVLTQRRHSLRIISMHTQWLLSLYAMVYLIGVTLFSLHYLPLIEFTPYATGVSISDAIKGKQEMTFIYEKDGQKRSFDINHLPEDSAWSYVDTKTEVLEAPSIKDFSLIDRDGDELADEILADSGFVYIIAMPNPSMADAGCSDQLNDIYDFANDHQQRLLCATAGSSEEITTWIDRTGAAYPFVESSSEALNAMVRSNPGVLLLKNGKIIAKWSRNDLPDEVELKTITLNPELQIQRFVTSHALLKLFLWFIIPFGLLLLADRLWIGSRYYRIYKHYKSHNKKKMRKHIVAGNWKMNKNLQEGLALAAEVNEILKNEKPNCEVILGTPFIHLAKVSELVDHSLVKVSAENCANHASGAYTGEVSAEMVKSTGAEYVILGHSERREYYSETPEVLKEKVDLALANGLKVVFCIGESLAQREAGEQEVVCKVELEGSVFHLSAEEWKNIVIAYEPIWAIGTGKTATSDQAQEIHAFIRKCVAEKYGQEAADNTSILYGGSCNGKNAPELFAKEDIDGGLIGGASLKAADFKLIIDAWK